MLRRDQRAKMDGGRNISTAHVSHSSRDTLHSSGIAAMEVYGFALKPEYSGLTFAQLVLRCKHEYDVTLVACQIEGKVCVARMRHEMVAGTICFAMAPSDHHVKPLHDGSDWVDTCRTRRRNRWAQLSFYSVSFVQV